MERIPQEFTSNDWLSLQEGKLSVDVVETEDYILIRAAIAGVNAEDLDITLSNDTLTIRGERKHECYEDAIGDTHVQECHWGAFSRTVILPSHVDQKSIDATLKRGILMIRIKKEQTDRNVPIFDLDDL